MTKQEQLKQAYNLIFRASEEERREALDDMIEPIEKNLKHFKKPEDPFYPYNQVASNAFAKVRYLFFHLTGYRSEEVIYGYINRNYKPLSKKYTPDNRLFYCAFVDLLTARGSSMRQAIKLLSHLAEECKNSASGLERELYEVHEEYLARGYAEESRGADVCEYPWQIAEMLRFKFTELPTSTEKSFNDALNAFRQLWQDVIDVMKEHHETLKQKDGGYPDVFGCAIGWVESDFDNPLDYFYNNPADSGRNFHERSNALLEYLNAVSYLREPQELTTEFQDFSS